MATLKTKIMRRVYFIWFLRILMRPWLVKGVLLTLFLWQLTVFVSVRNILLNWPLRGDFLANYEFVRGAFVNTELSTVVLVSAIFVVGAWLLRDVFTSRRPMEMLARV